MNRLLNDKKIINGVNSGGLAEGGKLISLTDAGRKEYLGVCEAQDAETLKAVWEWLKFHRKTGHLNKLVIENLLMPALKQGRLPK